MSASTTSPASPSNIIEPEPRSVDDVVSSIIRILHEYKKDIQDTIRALDGESESLHNELEIVSESLHSLLQSLSELNDAAIKILQENMEPNERTSLLKPREKSSKRVVFGDVTNSA